MVALKNGKRGHEQTHTSLNSKKLKSIDYESENESGASIGSEHLESSSEDDLDQIVSESESDSSDRGIPDETLDDSLDDSLKQDDINESVSKTSKEQHLEQKKLREARRVNKPDGHIIQQIKQIWERLRVKSGTPLEVRKKLIDQIWDLTKDKIKDLVLKHDASRIIQTIFKYSDKKKRLAITKALKGTYTDLAKSSYGKYLLVKFLHYGSSEVREDIINELHGSYRKLMKHKEGAYVIEDIYRDYSTALQKKRIIREFYGSEYAIFKDSSLDKTLSQIIMESPDKRPYLMKNLKEVITSAVNKGSIGFTIIHAAMLEYVRNINLNSSEREEFVDLITEQFAEIVHTNEGSQVASFVLSITTAKERKGLVRALKPFVSKLADDEYGHFVLITLFSTVDDTIFVSKAFVPELRESMSDLIISKHGRRPFLYVLLGRSSRYFSPTVLAKLKEIDEWKKGTSKKDDEVRRSELNVAFSPLILKAISENISVILKVSTGSQFVAEALLHSKEADRAIALKAVAEACSGEVSNEKHLIQQAYIGRMLRSLIQEGHWNNDIKMVDKIDVPNNFKHLLFSVIKNDLAEWALGNGSFVIISLLENLEKEEHDEAIKILKRSQKEISAVAITNKGARLIESILLAD